MKPLVIYYTKTQNTVAVAQAVTVTLDAELVPIDTIAADELPRLIADRPLICLGTGIYNTCPAKNILRILPQIPAGTKVFIFFTSGFVHPWLLTLYRSRFHKWLAKSNVELVGMWNAPGHDKYPLLKWANIQKGRPNTDDIEQLTLMLESL